MTILGTGFPENVTVSFGRLQADSVTWIGPTELHVVAPRRRVPTTPAGPASGRARRAVITEITVDVTVSDGISEHTLEGAYTYVPGVDGRR